MRLTREALAAVAEKKDENKFPVSCYSSIPLNINMDDKMKFNEDSDTYIAFFELQPDSGPCHLCPP